MGELLFAGSNISDVQLIFFIACNNPKEVGLRQAD